jgi:hypothetical protein
MSRASRSTLQGRLSTRDAGVLHSLAANKVILSVGHSRMLDVTELITTARRVWQVPFFDPSQIATGDRAIRRVVERNLSWVDAGRLILTDGEAGAVLPMLHEDGFAMVYLHGPQQTVELSRLLEDARYLTRCIVVDSTYYPHAHEVIPVFCGARNASWKFYDQLTVLTPDKNTDFSNTERW